MRTRSCKGERHVRRQAAAAPVRMLHRSPRRDHYRSLRCEPLEERRLLAMGDLVQTLVQPIAPLYEQSAFGYSAAVSGSTVVVGNPTYDRDVPGHYPYGVAYVFNSDTGKVQHVLSNPNPVADGKGIHGFGGAVAVSGNLAVVGAGLAGGMTSGGLPPNEAYVFDTASGRLLQTLKHPGVTNSWSFGRTVAISGNLAVVSDPFAWNAAVHVYDASSGSLLRSIDSPFGSVYFGDSVGLSGNTLVVGCREGSPAYVFDATTGVLQHRLSDPSPAANHVFGCPVEISGTRVAVRDQTRLGESAWVHLFDATSGAFVRTISDPTPEENNLFGNAIALSGAAVVVYEYPHTYIFHGATGELLHTVTTTVGGGYGNEQSFAASGNRWVRGCGENLGGGVVNTSALVYDVSLNNDPPMDLVLLNDSIAEHCPVGTLVGPLLTIDPNPREVFTYRLVAGPGDADNAKFTIDPQGNLYSAAVFDYVPGNYLSIRVRTTDGGGLSYEEALAIQVTQAPAPRIETISISPDEPVTRANLTLAAQIQCTPPYEITSVSWSLTDVATGVSKHLTANANPYTFQPAAGTHGLKEATCTIFYREIVTGETGRVQKSKQFKLFFDKDQASDPTNPRSPPNWFVYWGADGAVPGLGQGVLYDGRMAGWGEYDPYSGEITLAKAAGVQQYDAPIVISGTFFGAGPNREESFGGPSVQGIDCAAGVLAHERYHVWVDTQWKTGNQFFDKTDSDRKEVETEEGKVYYDDKLPDFYEDGTTHTRSDSTDTYNVAKEKGEQYAFVGDQEYWAMRIAKEARGVAAKDWAKPGKQTTGTATASLPGAPPLRLDTASAAPAVAGTARFTGSYSDQGVDADGDSFLDYLIVTAEVQIDVAGEYSISAWLTNAAGDIIAINNKRYAFEPSAPAVPLAFDGLTIHHFKTDGPYHFSVVLGDLDGYQLDSHSNVYDTAAYPVAQFQGQQAWLAGAYSDRGVDGNSDGIFESLRVEAAAEVTVAGRYKLAGQLYDGTGNPIAFASQVADLNPGTVVFTLDFSGLAIAINGTDGPCTVGELFLYDVDDALLDFVSTAYQTGTYGRGQFQSPSAALRGVSADHGLDADGNRKFESLVVDVGIDVAAAGAYSLIGALYDGNNQEIAVASVQANLTAGAQTVALTFAGSSIYQHRINGPYQVRHLAIYDANAAPVSIADQPGLTATYHYKAFGPPGADCSTAGTYDPVQSKFYLKFSNGEGFADLAFGFGAPGWKSLAGDWDGDGRDTIGLFQPEAAQFYLRNSNASGPADISFGYGDASQGDQYVLVMGDWNGDGVDTVGLYHKPSAAWFLRNSNSQGNADITFGFGAAGSAWTPVVGDWNGDGVDTIGLYDPATGMFYLRNSQTTGMADIAFPYGAPGAGWTPLIGDWDGDSVESAGFYQPGTASHFYLRNTFSPGMADVHFGLGFAGVQPIVGDWLGPTGQPLLATAPIPATTSPAGVAQGDLQPILTEALARWAATGVPSTTIQAMQRAQVVVADLPGGYLGKVDTGQIYLDRDAAGHGWFIDPTPALDEEFARLGAETQFTAVDARAADKIDLLTVIKHELGHSAGLNDLDTSATSLMSGTLPTGVRRGANANGVDAVFGAQGVR